MEMSIMEQIKGLLAQGRTSGAIIAMGYKPSTVYKVQYVWRLESGDVSPEETEIAASEVGISEEESPMAQGTDFDELTEQEAKELLEVLAEDYDEMMGQVRDAETKVEESERTVKTLEDKVRVLEPEASKVITLRERIRELEGEIEHYEHTQVSFRQGYALMQQEKEAEKTARGSAESQRREAFEIIGTLRKTDQEQRQYLGLASRIIEKNELEAGELRPLKVWVGHPCTVCKKPHSGVVDRELAASLLENVGHKECNDLRASRIKKILVGAAAVYGVSKLR